MSTSGTTTWSPNRDEIITSALNKLAVLSGGSAPEAYQTTAANRALNAMLKTFQADGMPVWAIKSYNFNTVAGTSDYTIGVGQTLNTPAPLKVTQVFRAEGTNSNIPLNIYTKYNFNLLPIASALAPPVNIHYQPFPQTGQLSLWPTPDRVYPITLVYQRPFEDMNGGEDDIDFPSYWSEAIIYGLAWRLAPEYGVPTNDRAVLKSEAEFFHQTALGFGTEEGSLYLQPNWAGL